MMSAHVTIRSTRCILAGSSLWWNLLWWERTTCDSKDITIGWTQNIVLFAISAGLGFYFGGFSLCLIINGTLHTITLCIGLSLRSGTKLTTR